MSVRSTLVSLLSAAVVAAGLTAPAATPAVAEEAPAAVRFGSVGFGSGQPYGTGLIGVAQVKGFVEDEFKGTPTKVEWTYFHATGPAINEALANRQVDFGVYGGLPNIIGKAGGLPTRIVLAGGPTRVFAVARADQPIADLKDLKGRRIAVQKATIIHFVLLRALEANGLTEKDVTLVDLKNADQLAALTAGSVDAAFGASFLLPLRDKGVVKVIYSTRQGPSSAQTFSGVLVHNDFARQYPEATAKVVRGFVRAAHWASFEENREEAVAVWSKSGIPSAVLKEDYDGEPLRSQFNILIDDYTRARFADGIAFARQQKLIRTEIDLDAWFDPSYLAAALKDLKLEDFWPRRAADGTPRS
ncbi:sulfonate transport system substrate-binding protein [Azospirillum fermentarium]|uniref:ABC transporter substrate-binding protein n=1 Tax=Azospirillum fermentarium TaxID=1233114 RepID=UPI002226C8B1|nr:ABC transporter substrate-binding protein [Azospirillum fermentarium]MCW2247924.1 sulfonate transport system substrate-binding protein [Azospirillum fermentarium]